MDILWEGIADWLKEILVSGILSNLSGMFDSVNGQVGDISAQVGTTPQAWNSGIFNMVQNLSNTVVLPIAGIILTFVMTLELIQMVTDRNSDMYIQFDNGTSLHIGNYDTLQAVTDKVQNESVTRAFLRYNPEIVAVTKEAALAALRKREVEDNMIAAQKGLKPYTLLNVELASGTDDRSLLYTGWYYVTLAVDGKIHAHLETGLDHEIAHGKVSETPSQYPYLVAGAIKESEVDYVFDNSTRCNLWYGHPAPHRLYLSW